MAITPDRKDWTWVIERRCPECGFDPGRVAPRATGQLIRDNARSWQDVVKRTTVQDRLDPEKWSDLEYACHVRDVHTLFLSRLDLMLQTDEPTFANWDQDETAANERYDLQDPEVVGRELSQAAQHHASRYDTVSGSHWDRRGTRSNGSAFTIATLAVYLSHDLEHHLWDVGAARRTDG